jgi:hypothetical protein
MADKPPPFASKPDDPKDVSWGLKTAEACWRRGERAEALKWLRRAVEAASEAEVDERALELAKIAADLATQMAAAPVPTAAASGPVLTPPGAAGRGAVGAPKQGGPTRSPSQARLPGPKDLAPKKSDRKSMTNEASRNRPSEVPIPRPAEKAQPVVLPAPAAPRKRAASRADRLEAPRRPHPVDDMDSWPTDVLTGDDLPPGLGAENLKGHGAGHSKGTARVHASQAVQVLVWRDRDGSVHMTARERARDIPAHAVEAMLVATDPAADLVALLGEPH